MDPGAAAILAVLALVVGVLLARHHQRMARVRVLRRAGFTVSMACVGFIALLLAGETMADPGGWHGIALITIWAVPLAIGMQLGWYKPALAGGVFAAVTAVVTAMNLWFAADTPAWRSFEHVHGPVRAVFVIVATAGLAVYGLGRTGPAGVMLLVLGGVPIAAGSARDGFSSLVAAAAVPTVTGALYVASSLLEHREHKALRPGLHHVGV